MKKSMTLALAASIFAIALATTPHNAFASNGKHIKMIRITLRSSTQSSQASW
jgi:hypothetical protein